MTYGEKSFFSCVHATAAFSLVGGDDVENCWWEFVLTHELAFVSLA